MCSSDFDIYIALPMEFTDPWTKLLKIYLIYVIAKHSDLCWQWQSALRSVVEEYFILITFKVLSELSSEQNNIYTDLEKRLTCC